MRINLEKAIQLYGYIDRRVPAKREAILSNLRPPDNPQRQRKLSAKLFLLFCLIYLYIDYHFDLASEAQPEYNKELNEDLDLLFNTLEQGKDTQVAATVGEMSSRFLSSAENIIGRQVSFDEIQLDLSSFENRLLIGNLAFQNYCRLRCKHCANDGQWDKRSHDLSALESVLPKIRFPSLANVNISYHEPLTLPFLLDLVKLLLKNEARPCIVTSGRGIQKPQVHATMDKLSQLHQTNSGKLYVALSFDLFRRHHDLAFTASLLSNYPVIERLKVTSGEHNHAETIDQLRALEKLVSTAERKEVVQRAIASHGPNLLSTGAAMSFLLDYPEIIMHYLSQEIFPLWRNKRLSPHIHPFFLFPGGTIAPHCNSEAAHFRSFGNIFEDSVEKIYANIRAFERTLSDTPGASDYHSLVFTERSRRRAMGLPEDFVTHYDILAERLSEYNRKKGLLLNLGLRRCS